MPQALKEYGPYDGPKEVRSEVAGIVSAAAGDKGLVGFVDGTDEGHQNDDDEHSGGCVEVGPMAEDGGGEESSAAEKVSEVENLVDMPELDAGRHVSGFRREHPQHDEPDGEGGKPGGGAAEDGHQ